MLKVLKQVHGINLNDEFPNAQSPNNVEVFQDPKGSSVQSPLIPILVIKLVLIPTLLIKLVPATSSGIVLETLSGAISLKLVPVIQSRDNV